MKFLFVCSLLCLPFTVLKPVELSAQQLTAYNMTRIDVPTSFSGGRVRVNNLGIVRVEEGHIHDQNGLVGNGTLNTTYSIYDLADVPADWTNLVLHNGNDGNLEVVGRIIDPVGVMRGFYVDLSIVNSPTGKSNFQLLPDLGSPLSAARAINNDGDIAVQYQLPDGSWSVYVVHRDNLGAFTLLGYEIANSWPFHMNNRIYDAGTGQLVRDAQLMVELPNGDISLYTLGDPVSEVRNLDVLAGENVQGMDLNDYGDVSGRINRSEVVPGKGKKTRIVNTTKAMLFQSPFVSAPMEIAGIDTAWGTNNAGDVVGTSDSSESAVAVLVKNGVSFNLNDYVTGPIEELDFWFGGRAFAHDINERNSTGFGQIVVSVSQTGKGRNRQRGVERRLYLLTPVVQ